VNDLTTGGLPSATALTKLGMVYGTPEYMAPEQALGEEIDGRADLYAVGVMFYEMLCGVRPFEADSRVALLGMVATKKPPRLAERVPGTDVPSPIERIVMRLLDKSTTARFANADELLEAIDTAMIDLDYPLTGTRGVRIEPPSPSPPPLAIRTEGVISPPPPALAASHAERRASSVRTVGSVPIPAAMAAAGLVATAAIVVVAVLVRGTDPIVRLEANAAASAGAAAGEAPPPEPGDIAPDSDLAAARSQGLAGLGSLAQKYPKDPAVLRALLFAHARDPGGYAAASGVAKRLLEIAPKMALDDDLQRFLLAAANGSPDAIAPALDVMAASMGSTGPDLLYQVVANGSRGKERAAKLLEDPSVIEKSTAAVRIAFALQMASSCKAKKPLLERAAEQGDERAAAILRPLITSKGRGCGIFGLGGCPAPCQSIAKDIQKALGAMEARGIK
jgi:hypothetical protein